MTQESLFGGAETPSNPVKQCAQCGEPFTPYSRREGCQRFCGSVCSDRWWNAQKKPTKLTRAEKILRRLREGSATGLELLQAGGGTRYGARVHELRLKGHRISVDKGVGEWPVYRLEE